MPLTHIEHYLVLTDDLDGTRNFYCKGLGMRVGARPPMAFLGYWLYVGDIPCIHVAEWESYRVYSTEAGIGISTRDLRLGLDAQGCVCRARGRVVQRHLFDSRGKRFVG